MRHDTQIWCLTYHSIYADTHRVANVGLERQAPTIDPCMRWKVYTVFFSKCFDDVSFARLCFAKLDNVCFAWHS